MTTYGLFAFSKSKEQTMTVDWHAGPITRTTPLDKHYRNTQKVRQFLLSECGAAFKFDRGLMLWIKSGTPSTMGDVADEWLRRYG
jgi:hypothetical protein